ncbi:hypothetical protein AQ436_06690 [Arthrobacter sp. EpRS66]|nr:hypothetical protein AQ436_06690 [Arthrobacter sp. EpRS66]
MAKHEATTTQGAHPWRATARTIFAAVIALAALAPLIYTAAAQQSPELATGAVGGVLVAAGAITRIMAIPGVEAFLQRFAPFLSAAQRNDPNVTGEAVSEFDALLREGKGSYPVSGPHAPTEADPARYEGDK